MKADEPLAPIGKFLYYSRPKCAESKSHRPRMIDFEVKRTSRRCSQTGRDLKPGETFFSELVRQDNEMVRKDICEAEWKGPSEGSIGWWKCRIPSNDSDRVYWAPRDVLLSYFEQLLESKDKEMTAYVMSLLLIRKRMLQMVDTHDEAEPPYMELAAGKQKMFQVPIQSPTQDQIKAIQQELAEQLFVDHPPGQE